MCEEISNSVVRLCSIVTATGGRSIMKSNLLYWYKLDKKIAKLERLVTERSVGRGGPSKAYQIWDYLMNNGPKSVSDLKSALPKDITNFINFFADNNLLSKDGNMISANTNYKWDDVGVIPRTAQQELMNDLRNAPDISSLDSGDTAEEPSAPTRAPRARRVKANIFSKKVEEVKAALDEGVDVNTEDDKGRTPLMVACMARKGDTGAVIKLLLDNGADPNVVSTRPAVTYAVMFQNKDGVIALANAGANLAVYGKDDRSLMFSIIGSGLFNTNEVNSMITEDYIKELKERRDIYGGNLTNLLGFGYNKLDSATSYVNHLVDVTIKALGKESAARHLYPDLDSAYWLLTANALERNGVAILFNDSMRYVKEISNNKQIADKIYDLAEKVSNGSIAAFNLAGLCKAVVAICNKYNKSPSILSGILTQSSFDAFNAKDQWVMLQSAIYTEHYFGGNSSALVQCLTKLKFKAPESEAVSDVINTFCIEVSNYSPSDLLVRLVCRKLRPYTNLLSKHNIYIIANSANYRFIDAMVDAGIGEDLAREPHMSDICRSVLRSNDIVTADNTQQSDDVNLVRSIVKHIANDTMSTSVRQAINENPAVLSNDKIQDALNDPSNADSVTARQLKRQYDQWAALPENKKKYDL